MNKIQMLRRISESDKTSKIGGKLITPYDASCILEVYDSIHQEAQNVYYSMTISQMLETAYQFFPRQK